MEENNTREIADLAEKIVSQTLQQRISAISFDHRIYPFVKEYLENSLDQEIVYHSWDLSLGLFDVDLKDHLSQKNYYTDQRVKTILLPYKSPFTI